jgi:four helix bundle protein
MGSASEVEYLILLSKDLNLIEESKYILFDKNINTIKRKIHTLKQKLK